MINTDRIPGKKFKITGLKFFRKGTEIALQHCLQIKFASYKFKVISVSDNDWNFSFFEVSTHLTWLLSLQLGYREKSKNLKCCRWIVGTQSMPDEINLVVKTVVSSLQLNRISASTTPTWLWKLTKLWEVAKSTSLLSLFPLSLSRNLKSF